MQKSINTKIYLIVLLVALFTYSHILSAESHTQDQSDAETASQIRENLSKILNEDIEIGLIEKSEMTGAYVVSIGDQEVFVYSKNNHLMIGDVFDMETQQNLKAKRRNQKLYEIVEQIPESDMVVMGPKLDRHITVFTDTDCYYCQQLNKTVPDLQEHGVQVRYLMFPRAGLDSDSYREAVSVWCADDQAKAMTRAKRGKKIAVKNCDNPVRDQYLLGQKMGILGTPTIIFDTGQIVPGFLPTDELLEQMGINN